MHGRITMIQLNNFIQPLKEYLELEDCMQNLKMVKMDIKEIKYVNNALEKE